MEDKFFLLREIAENIIFDKEKFCFRYNIQFEKFDKYMNELEYIDKYIFFDEKQKKMCIANKGYEYLYKYKVDTAVLLASGIGSRMGELTQTTSKCLMQVNGEILIERLIKQLLEKNIKEIVVLVGHVKKQFEYLENKFNVKLVYNDDYNTKNTIASFYHVIDYIKNKNSYIIASDIYLEENIFYTYEISPYYIGSFIDNCSGEWIYDYDYNKKVYGVEIGDKLNYYLGGFSFHTKDFINKLIDLVEQEYKKEDSYNKYWEEVLVENFSNLPDFYVRTLPDGVMKEFDTVEDINKVENRVSYIKNIIANILKIKNEDEITLEKTITGISNESYLLNYNEKKYIVRIPGVATELFVDRKKEKEVYEKLNKYNITDEVLYFDEKSGIKISKFIENSKIIDINNEIELKKCISIYKKLHTLNIYIDKNINIINVLYKYINIMEKYKIKFLYNDFQKILKNCEKLNDYIKKFDRPNCLCHGDCGYANVLFTKNDIKIIDFEFAGMADPLTDIALFSVYSDLDINKTFKILKIYKNEFVDNEDALKIDKLDFDDMSNIVISYMAIDSISCIIWDLIIKTLTSKKTDRYAEKKFLIYRL